MDRIKAARDRALSPTERAAAKLASANKLFVRDRIDLLRSLVAGRGDDGEETPVHRIDARLNQLVGFR